jgi:hypothetical protein
MKNLKTVFAVAMLASLAFAFSGCAKDPDESPDTGTRAAFLGTWNVQETWTKLSYDVIISADPNSSNGVFISEFAGTLVSSPPASAVVSGNSIVLDDNQVIGEGWTVYGSGTLSGGKITWNYTILDGATQINAYAVYTKP